MGTPVGLPRPSPTRLGQSARLFRSFVLPLPPGAFPHHDNSSLGRIYAGETRRGLTHRHDVKTRSRMLACSFLYRARLVTYVRGPVPATAFRANTSPVVIAGERSSRAQVVAADRQFRVPSGTGLRRSEKYGQAIDWVSWLGYPTSYLYV